jgi:hypothetical protein
MTSSEWLSVIVLAAATAFAPGCKKGDATTESTAQSAAPKGATLPSFNVPFKGNYKRTAKVAYKNGQRIRTSTSEGFGTLSIEAGRVVFHVEYPEGARTAHVTETYRFAESDIRAIPEGYDVPLVFVNMDSDTKNYNPDSKVPKLEARKQAGGWEIGFLFQDTGGVQVGMEFH